MLEILTNTFGVSGCDDEVKKLILKEITPFCDNLEIMKDGLTAFGYNDVLVDYRMRDDSMTASKTKMIKPQWNIYRKVLKMNVFASAYYLFCWGINGLLKYKTGKK